MVDMQVKIHQILKQLFPGFLRKQISLLLLHKMFFCRNLQKHLMNATVATSTSAKSHEIFTLVAGIVKTFQTSSTIYQGMVPGYPSTRVPGYTRTILLVPDPRGNTRVPGYPIFRKILPKKGTFREKNVFFSRKSGLFKKIFYILNFLRLQASKKFAPPCSLLIYFCSRIIKKI